MDLCTPKVMGILNVTPDSFYDGGLYNRESDLLKQAEKMILEGADFIDIKALTSKEDIYSFIIHWAGMKFNNLKDYPRSDIMEFYLEFYYSKFNFIERLIDKIISKYVFFEKKYFLPLKNLPNFG